MVKLPKIIKTCLILSAIFLFGGVFIPSMRAEKGMAGIFFARQETPEQVKEKYRNALNGGEKFKILISPGHDPQSKTGARFKEIKEHELNLKLGLKLFYLLSQDPRLDVIISRSESGYQPYLADYFKNNRQEIIAFRSTYMRFMNLLLDNGVVVTNQTVQHNYSDPESSIKLYGMNKWANENGVDLVISIHFNDYPGHSAKKPGRYSGFAIYIPEKQYNNYSASLPVAQSVFDQLKEWYPVSNMPKEKKGIIEDQDLIAVGSQNTLDAPALLIEYAYIYQPILSTEEYRERVTSDFANKTYLGIINFLNN